MYLWILNCNGRYRKQKIKISKYIYSILDNKWSEKNGKMGYEWLAAF